MNDMNTDEVIIDLADMFFFILKKWRSLIAAVLVFAVFGAAWSMLPDAMLKEEDLSDAALINMEKAQEQRKLYDLKQRYIKESLLMTMDLENLYHGTLNYHVSADRNLNMIRAEYNSLMTDAVFEQIRQASGYDVELKYIRELVGYDVHIVSDDRGDNSTTTLDISCSVTADSEEKCIAMLNVVRERIEEMQKFMPGRYADYKYIKSMDAVSPLESDWHEENRINNESEMNGYMEAAVASEKTLSNDELYYYTVAVLGIAPEEPGLGYYMKKIVVLAFVGGVLWAVWFFMKYLTDSSVKTVSEAERLSNRFLFGRVKSERNLKGIDKWLDGIQEKFRYRLDDASYVAAVIDSHKTGEAVLCGNREADEVCRIMDKLTQNCGGLIPCSFTFSSVEALKKAKEVGQAILVVRTGKTKKSELLRELEMCKMQGVTILGLIVAD